MRYRVQVTVGIGRLAAIIEEALQNNPEPDLVVEQVPEREAEAPGYAFTRKTVDRHLYPKKIGTEIRKIVKAKAGATGTRQEIIVASLKTGPKRWAELKAALTAGGLAESSLNNMIGQMKRDGKIQRSEDGLWSLVEHERTGTA